MRLIDADALKENINKFIGYLDEDMISRIKVVIDNAPTVEVYTKDDMTKEYLKGYNDCKEMTERPNGDLISRKSSIPDAGESFDEINEAYDMAIACFKELKAYREASKKLNETAEYYKDSLFDDGIRFCRKVMNEVMKNES